MKASFLTLRISRRAVAAVTLADETLGLAYGRHLSSRTELAIRTVTSYAAHLLDLTHPSRVVVDAPDAKEGSLTGKLLAALDDVAHARGVPVHRIAKHEVLAAYGLSPVRNRRELRTAVRRFWPELERIKGQVEPYIVDAAAAALHAEIRMRLDRGTT